MNATEWSRFNAVCESKPQDFALRNSALSIVTLDLVPGTYALGSKTGREKPGHDEFESFKCNGTA